MFFIPPIIFQPLSRIGGCSVPKCRHCGVAYPLGKDKRSFMDWAAEHPLLTAPTLALGTIWLTVTMMLWINPYDEPQTLIAVIDGEIHWLIALLHRIW